MLFTYNPRRTEIARPENPGRVQHSSPSGARTGCSTRWVWRGYVDAKRKLPEQRNTRFNITVRQNWWGYESRDGGTAEITLRLNTAPA
jgi:hypothetical protein